MKTDEARGLKALEVENARPKRLVADPMIDISILKDAHDYLGKHRAPVGAGRRGVVRHMQDQFKQPERRVCRVLGQPRLIQRYASILRDSDDRLV